MVTTINFKSELIYIIFLTRLHI